MLRVPIRARPSNKGLQLTKAARCAPFAFRSWGQSLRAAFAADPQCYAGARMAAGYGGSAFSPREVDGKW